jgi:hypothetical protein
MAAAANARAGLAVVALQLIACVGSDGGRVSAPGGVGADASSGSGGSGGSGGGEAPRDTASPLDAPAPADAPTDPPSMDARAGACAGLFCEDFEQGQLDPAKWQSQTGGSGMATVQEQTVAHGRYALHVHGSGVTGHFATVLTRNVPAALRGAGPVFGRVYLYLGTSIGGTHIQLGLAGTTGDPNVAPTISTSTTVTVTSPMKSINFNYMEFAYFANSWQLGFDLFNPAPTIAKQFVEEASYPPARDRYPVATWSCVEWRFGDDPADMSLWVDGTQMDQLNAQHIDFSTTAKTPGSVLNGQSSGIIGGFSFYGLGFHNWGASGAVDLYYDDLVLDTRRVGCLAAP